MYDAAGLECAYRVFGNADIDWGELLGGHQRATAERCGSEDLVLVVHDTTEIGLPRREHLREGFSKLSSKRQGFYLHTTLVVSPEDNLPLGVVSLQPYVHKSQVADDETKQLWQELGGIYNNEQERWIEAVERAEEQLAHRSALIHVFDSEADAYETLCPLLAHEQRFVVRAQQDNRRTTEGNLADVIAALPVRGNRTLDIQIRHAATGKGTSKRRAARKPRECKVALRAGTVSLRRPDALGSMFPSTIQLNVVDVRELNPADEKDVICWTLLTVEAIETDSELDAIVDAYRSRWVIEEFFKALKTGCLAESRQLESIDAYLKFLAMAMPVAVRMLQLRTLARVDATSAKQALTELQRQILAAHPRCKLQSQPTASDFLYAVASLGGHLKNNGPPGWLTLYRGFQQLTWLEDGWLAAHRQKNGNTRN